MKRYSEKTERAAGRLTHSTAVPDTLAVLRSLRLIPDPETGEPLMAKTGTKKHYRMSPRLAKVIGIPTVELPAGQQPDLATELATVHDTLSGITGYVEDCQLPPSDIVAGIRCALAQKRAGEGAQLNVEPAYAA